MEFLIGLLLGMGLALVIGEIARTDALISDVEKSEETPAPDQKNWVQTRNFLYYDGTVMPDMKEDAYEHKT